MVKNPPANAGRHKRHRFHPWVGNIPCRKAWQPTPVFLPAKSHGQRDRVGYRPWVLTELNMTELMSTRTEAAGFFSMSSPAKTSLSWHRTGWEQSQARMALGETHSTECGPSQKA